MSVMDRVLARAKLAEAAEKRKVLEEYAPLIIEDAARAERERVRGELTREAVENVNGVYVVALRHVERICAAPADAPDWRDVARRLLKIALDAGVWQTAPCQICGYNGPGYFQADTHPCSHGDVDAVLARVAALARGEGAT